MPVDMNLNDLNGLNAFKAVCLKQFHFLNVSLNTVFIRKLSLDDDKCQSFVTQPAYSDFPSSHTKQ